MSFMCWLLNIFRVDDTNLCCFVLMVFAISGGYKDCEKPQLGTMGGELVKMFLLSVKSLINSRSLPCSSNAEAKTTHFQQTIDRKAFWPDPKPIWTERISRKAPIWSGQPKTWFRFALLLGNATFWTAGYEDVFRFKMKCDKSNFFGRNVSGQVWGTSEFSRMGEVKCVLTEWCVPSQFGDSPCEANN